MEMEWLCWLFGALLIITLLGHGIWVVVAKVLTIGQPRTPRPSGNAVDELLGAEIQVARLLHAGLIDRPAHDRVVNGLRMMRVRNVGRPAHVLPIAVPLAPTQSATEGAPPIQSPPPLPSTAAQPIPGIQPPILPVTPVVSRPVAPPLPATPRAHRPAPPPKTPRRSLSEILAAFMKQSNIRWGELVGGLLIIGCSIALVVSFWNQIADKPFFQFGIFTTVTAALMGLGLYAEHRWKLPTTSRGILLIATLLVPLNFLAFAALSHGAPAIMLVTLAEIAALGLFGYLVTRAAQVLSPYWPRLFTAGIVGLSASLLLEKHLGPAQSPAGLWGLAGLPVAIYGAATAVMLARAARWKQVREHAAEAIFLLLGVLTFGTALALGLVVFQTLDPWHAAQSLAPLLSIAAMPGLATGLILWRGITSKKLAKTRTAGTSIAIASALLMLGAIDLAWPDPARMLPMALIDFAALSAIGILFEIPAAHLLAGPCLVLAYLLGFHLSWGHIGWTATPPTLIAALTHPSGGAALLPLFAVIAASATALVRMGRKSEAKAYWLVDVAVAVASLGLASAGGFAVDGDPFGTVWVYFAYATAALAAAWKLRRQEAGWIGCLLVLAGFVQVFVTWTHVSQPWSTALLAYATAAIIARVAMRRDAARWDAIRVPAKWTAISGCILSLGCLLFGLSFENIGAIATHLFWIAGLWLVLAWDEDSTEIFVAGQLMLFLGAGLETIARLASRAWFHDAQLPLVEPWTLQAIGLTLGLLALGFTILRLMVPSPWRVSRHLRSPGAIDRLVSMAIGLGLAALVVSATAPALQIEYATGIARGALGPWALHAVGPGSWLVLAVLLVTFGLWAWQKLTTEVVLGLTGIAALACPLWAARWADAGAAGSALRWALAVFLLAGSVPLWMREQVPGMLGQRLMDRRFRRSIRSLLVTLCAIPILGLSIYPAELTLSGLHIAGPAPSCFFSTIGNAASYVVPLLLVAVVFVGFAIRERSVRWAFAACGVLNLTTTLGYALAVATAGRSLDAEHLIRLVQLNVITLTGFALAWQAARALFHRTIAPAERTPLPLRIEIGLAIAGNVILLLPGGFFLFVAPGSHAPGMAMLGDPVAWAALVLTVGATLWAARLRADRISTGALAVLLVAAAMMPAFAAETWNQANWLSYHIAIGGLVAATAAMLGLGVWIGRARRGVAELMSLQHSAPVDLGGITNQSAPIPLQYQRQDQAGGTPVQGVVFAAGEALAPALLRWIGALSALVVLFALRAMAGDPQRPWWSAMAAVILSVLWIGLACWTMAPRLLYAGGALLNVGATFWCMDVLLKNSPAPLLDLLLTNVSVLALFGLATLVLHLQVFVPRSRQGRPDRQPFHRFAAAAATLAVVVIAPLMLRGSLTGWPLRGTLWMAWGAWGASALLAAATLWDAHARRAIVQLYALGLAAIAIALGQWDLPAQTLESLSTIMLAGFVLVTGGMLGVQDILRRVARRSGMPLPDGPGHAGSWVLPANLIFAGAAVALAIAADFTVVDGRLRLAAAAAALLQIAGLVIGARASEQAGIRTTIIGIAAAAAVAFGWGCMQPAHPNPLDRAAVSMVVLAIAAAACTFVSTRLTDGQSAWSTALRKAAPWLGAACGVNLSGILGIELAAGITGGQIVIHGASTAAVIVALLGAAAATLALALRRRPDPFGLPESRRSGYVYASEALLALTFVHLRLTAPWLFGGVLAQYWPLLVMGLAFAGVALSELFRRRHAPVLAEPLMRTGIFLPLLPVMAFWLAPSRVDFSSLMFAVGAFYAILSATRRSFLLGILAALAGNGGLWSLLYHHPQFGFLVHPQLWLIPVALSVLAAAQSNRDRLSAPQLRFVRYASLMVIYVSSTADIFLNGVHEHPWLPLVLAALSVAGVMTGMLARLRAFLFLGTAFLTLSVGTMIYYASVNLGWTWLWYVAGIALGTAIIATFALFEKKRSEMVALVEGLKQWQ